MTVAIIADVVASREAPDRDRLQRDLESAIASAARVRPQPVRPWRPTAGDELQAVCASVGDALVATLALQLSLPDDVTCRFGIGVGEVHPVASALSDAIEDGPGWWAAREAIERAEALGRGAARSWLAVHGTAPVELRGSAAPVNAYLALRDQALADLGGRARRVLLETWLGARQKDVAASEGITQAAVSQMVNRPVMRALRQGLAELVQASSAASESASDAS